MIKKYLKGIEFNKNTFISYLRFVVGWVFIYASLDKIANPSLFSDMIDSYQFSSAFNLQVFNNMLALSLPWLELILGVSLILGFFFDEALNFIIYMLLFFILVLTQAYIRDIELKDCGCGLGESSIVNTIFRDLILLFACIIIKFRGLIVFRKYM